LTQELNDKAKAEITAILEREEWPPTEEITRSLPVVRQDDVSVWVSVFAIVLAAVTIGCLCAMMARW
jgi:hypothetical protein